MKTKLIKEKERVINKIRKKSILSKLFGILPSLKKSGQELKDEMRKGW